MSGMLKIGACASLLLASSFVSFDAKADIPDAPGYADQQCGNGAWQALGYPSFESCYATAVSYYNEQTGGGDGGNGGGVGGTSPGTFIGDIPGYQPDFEHDCKTRVCGN